MFRRRPPAALPRVPDGTRVYAVGDVHGCDHLLRQLHEAIRDDLGRKKPARSIVVHLGDYVDRGPRSSQTLDLLSEPPPSFDETVCLLGPAELDPPDPALRLPGARIIEAPSMEELIALLASARAYLGNDAGVTHLAAAVGTPVVAVFGPTDPARWGPRGTGAFRVVRAPDGDLARLEEEPVHAALREISTLI